MTRILISGATGFVGKRLHEELKNSDNQVFKLSRKQDDSQTILWDINQKKINPEQLENFDSIIHLAGESILGLWTKKKKLAIYQSRIAGTALLVNNILKLKNPPKTFICASAIGIYGQNTSKPSDEESNLGHDFLALVCKDWEATCRPLEKIGIRVIHLRLGIVIDPSGGMLKQMILPFKLGLGAWLGNGKQRMAWVSLNDLVRVVNFILEDQAVSGPVNVVAPNLISNKDFCLALAKKLNRPCFFGIPAFLLSIVFGKDLSSMLLARQNVIAKKLLEANFQFQDQTIQDYFNKNL